MSDFNRTEALLTSQQRDAVRADQPLDQYQYAIPRRVRDSVLDMSLVHRNIGAEHVENAFDDRFFWDDDIKPAEMQHVFNELPNALALMFDGTARTSRFEDAREPYEAIDPEVLAMYEDFVETAIESVYDNRGVDIDGVDVTISVETGEVTLADP